MAVRHRLLLTLIVTAIASEVAASDRPVIRVGASVTPYLVSRVEGQPQLVTITERDVQNGYFDVEGLSVHVKTNDPGGYMVVFRLPASIPAVSAEVFGFDEVVRLGAGGGFRRETLKSLSPAAHNLMVRIRLSGEIRPGVYPSPVQVSIRQIS